MTGVTWQGLYWDYVDHDANPLPPNTGQWHIAITDTTPAGTFDLPSTVLTEEFPGADQVNSAYLGTTNLNGDTVPVYDFSYTLGAPIALQANHTYALSVYSSYGQDVSPTEVFSWMNSTTAGGYTIQYYDDTDLIERAGSRAFTILGTAAVPEPSSLALCGVGLLGLAGIARRRAGRARD